ncbi:hypothetical protein DAI22_05g237650 [Oryza sativa Japonica Group]|jgi:hypothetical protein|nr:hypothetical protein DAI22_05g237650 [Oryza sativa Japonica Group]
MSSPGGSQSLLCVTPPTIIGAITFLTLAHRQALQGGRRSATSRHLYTAIKFGRVINHLVHLVGDALTLAVLVEPLEKLSTGRHHMSRYVGALILLPTSTIPSPAALSSSPRSSTSYSRRMQKRHRSTPCTLSSSTLGIAGAAAVVAKPSLIQEVMLEPTPLLIVFICFTVDETSLLRESIEYVHCGVNIQSGRVG